jgi:hypothetical protein
MGHLPSDKFLKSVDETAAKMMDTFKPQEASNLVLFIF